MNGTRADLRLFKWRDLHSQNGKYVNQLSSLDFLRTGAGSQVRAETLTRHLKTAHKVGPGPWISWPRVFRMTSPPLDFSPEGHPKTRKESRIPADSLGRLASWCQGTERVYDSRRHTHTCPRPEYWNPLPGGRDSCKDVERKRTIRQRASATAGHSLDPDIQYDRRYP